MTWSDKDGSPLFAVLNFYGVQNVQIFPSSCQDWVSKLYKDVYYEVLIAQGWAETEKCCWLRTLWIV